VDADNEPIATTDLEAQNIIIPCARSIWTPETSGRVPYWEFLNEEGGCTVGGDSADYDTPDGPVVEKGGHAYILRSSDPSARTVYTCSSTLADCKDDLDQLTDFDTSGSTPSAADLGIASEDLTGYVNWTIGYDPNDVNKNDETDDMRPYVHGDVVHSRPVALDYNLDPNDPDVVVFYGANDGMLRAINGNPDGTGAGSEYWAFLPPEFYPNVKILRENSSLVRFPSSGIYAGSGIAKPYAMDGPLATYANDSDDDGDYDDVYLYAGMHRGGRVVYALEVSDIDAKPDLKWKIGCLNDPNDPDDCTSGTNEIGQTWSPFSIVSAAGYDSGDTPLIIMGGGYDNCEDNDAGSGGANHNCDYDGSGGDDNTGNRIYVLDALTGAILKTFETDRPVPGVVTVVPYVEGSGSYANLIKYAYAADTGGNVYRISADGNPGVNVVPRDIQNSPPSDWIITKIASLGCDEAEATGTGCTDGNPSNRKFIFGPDVVEIPDTEYLAILIGSGDREKPLTDYESAYNVRNYFFSIVDHPLTAGWLDDSGIDSNICDQVDGEDVLCMNSLTELGLDGVAGLAEGETLSQWGWKFELDDHEQVISGSLTIANDVFFSTHVPQVYTPGECEGDLGDAFTYRMDYLNADGSQTSIIGGGLVPTPVAGKVILDGYDHPVPFCIGCGGENSPIGGTQVSGSITWDQPKNRVYWNIQQ
jgi:type IV pilus assembly protein PilY1